MRVGYLCFKFAGAQAAQVRVTLRVRVRVEG